MPDLEGSLIPPQVGSGLRFENADIKTVVQAVIGDILGLPYFIDPQVQGTITLETNGQLDQASMLLVMEEALRMSGTALVKNGDGYLVVPRQSAPTAVTSQWKGLPETVDLPGFSVLAFQPEFSRPSELQNIIQPFAPQGGILRVDDGRNVLILAGTSQELQAMFQAAQTFDTNWMRNMSAAMYDVRYTDPESLNEELQQLFQEAGNAYSAVRLIPLGRIGKLLAVAPSRTQLEDVAQWVARLDIRDAGDGRRIYVYDVQYGRAEDLASNLNYILTGEDFGAGLGGQAGLNRQGNLARRTGASGQADNEFDELRILPNIDSNSLLIFATAPEYALVEQTLAELDTEPRQILIEATLAEVTLTDELRFGLQWFAEPGDNTITFSQSSDGGAASQFPGFSYLYTGATNARVVLNALEDVTDVNVISSPKLLVLNNQSAELQVGDEVPVPTQSAVSTQDTNSPIVNSIQYRNTGVILTVQPRINENGLVFLDISQEVSDVALTTSSGIDAPTINQRRLSSTIAVQSGDTIALGGLIRQTDSQTASGIPLVSDIPGLGYLFRDNNFVTRKTELIVLLTPRVIRDSEDTRETMQYLQSQFQKVFRDESVEDVAPEP